MQNQLQTHIAAIAALKTSIVETFSAHYDLPFDGSAVQTDIYLALYYYWELKAKRVSRTLQIIRSRGLLEAVDELVSRDHNSHGFDAFSANGQLDRTFEHVVMCHPTWFSDKARLRATARMM